MNCRPYITFSLHFYFIHFVQRANKNNLFESTESFYVQLGMKILQWAVIHDWSNCRNADGHRRNHADIDCVQLLSFLLSEREIYLLFFFRDNEASHITLGIKS